MTSSLDLKIDKGLNTLSIILLMSYDHSHSHLRETHETRESSESIDSGESLISEGQNKLYVNRSRPCRCKCSDECNMAIYSHFNKHKASYIEGLQITAYISLSLVSILICAGILIVIIMWIEGYF
jgi:hypothetical protein